MVDGRNKMQKLKVIYEDNHIIVVENEARAVLVYLWGKVHLGGNPRMDAGKLSSQDTYFI